METNPDRSELERYIKWLEAENEKLRRSNAQLRKASQTDQRTAAAIVETAGRFRTIFEYAPLAIMFTDREGAITTCNASALRLFGAPKSVLVGFSYRSIRDNAMHTAVAEALGGQKSRFEGAYLTVTGNVSTQMNANFSPAFDKAGSVSGVIGIFENMITSARMNKEKDRLIAELQGALRRGSKMGGPLPICASCKKIRDDRGRWLALETYFQSESDIEFSHGICPHCAQKLYPDLKRPRRS